MDGMGNNLQQRACDWCRIPGIGRVGNDVRQTITLKVCPPRDRRRPTNRRATTPGNDPFLCRGSDGARCLTAPPARQHSWRLQPAVEHHTDCRLWNEDPGCAEPPVAQSPRWLRVPGGSESPVAQSPRWRLVPCSSLSRGPCRGPISPRRSRTSRGSSGSPRTHRAQPTLRDQSGLRPGQCS